MRQDISFPRTQSQIGGLEIQVLDFTFELACTKFRPIFTCNGREDLGSGKGRQI